MVNDRDTIQLNALKFYFYPTALTYPDHPGPAQPLFLLYRYSSGGQLTRGQEKSFLN